MNSATLRTLDLLAPKMKALNGKFVDYGQADLEVQKRNRRRESRTRKVLSSLAISACHLRRDVHQVRANPVLARYVTHIHDVRRTPPEFFRQIFDGFLLLKHENSLPASVLC